MAQIDDDLDITSSDDPEIRQRWYSLGIYLQYDPVMEPAHTWVSEMGRNKYINSIYSALMYSGQGEIGTNWYTENENYYSYTTKQLIE